MARQILTLSHLNTLDQKHFAQALAGLFEGPPWIVTRAWDARPFASLERLHHVLREVMARASEEEQVALLRAHPDLVGRAALAGTLGPASSAEQAAAGLDHLSPGEIALFTRLNAAYRARFGFPFIICAREHQKESIMASFEARLGQTREREIQTALDEVAAICWLRLRDTLRADTAY